MTPYVHYSPFFFSLKLIMAQLYYLFRFPRKYIRALRRAIWQTWPEPVDLAKMLVIFPKSVYFARQVQEMKNRPHSRSLCMDEWNCCTGCCRFNPVLLTVCMPMPGIFSSVIKNVFGERLNWQRKLSRYLINHRQYLADLCQRWLPTDIRIVHCGLDPEEFSPAHVQAEDGVMRIISVGSLVEKKGHEYLIDACSQLVAKGYNIHCSIVGKGPAKGVLEAHIKEQDMQDTVLPSRRQDSDRSQTALQSKRHLVLRVSSPTTVTGMDYRYRLWKPWPCRSGYNDSCHGQP